jgi:hypothetical protein
MITGDYGNDLKLVQAWDSFVGRWQYQLLVTLQFNSARGLGGHVTLDRARAGLRSWDARVCRHLLGRHWATSVHRPFFFGFPEKLGYSPHWHCLVSLDFSDMDYRESNIRKLAEYAPIAWKAIVPAGDCDVKRIYYQHGIRKYLEKEMLYEINYKTIIVPDNLRH